MPSLQVGRTPRVRDINEPRTWLANGDIARMVAAVGSRQVMLVSDSCYLGSLAGNDKVQLGGNTDAGDLLKRRAVVMMSSGGNEPVADEGRNGHSVARAEAARRCVPIRAACATADGSPGRCLCTPRPAPPAGAA